MLKQLSFPLSLVAVAVLAACASRAQPVPTAVIPTRRPCGPATGSRSRPTATSGTPRSKRGAPGERFLIPSFRSRSRKDA